MSSLSLQDTYPHSGDDNGYEDEVNSKIGDDDDDVNFENGHESESNHEVNTNVEQDYGSDGDKLDANDELTESTYNEGLLSGYESNDDSDFGYCTSSDEEENAISRLASQMKKDIFRHEPDGKICLKKGQIFENVTRFREVLVDYSVQEGFIPVRTKNEKYRVNAKCKDDQCTWVCRAGWAADKVSFEIVEYGGVHICQRQTRIPDANAKWMCRKINEMVRETPDITIDFLLDYFRMVYGIETNEQQVYRARRKALDMLREDYIKSYAKLFKYGNIVKSRNQGTCCIVKCQQETPESTPLFHRFFLSLGCQKHGFISGCRPFIGLDGCHLKGPFGGVLLAAVALDANNGIFPLAVAICEAENSDSWGWFLFNLLEHLSDDSRTITFMSDRQKGLISAVEKVWPHAHHRYCARHLYNNYKKTCPGPQFRDQFWKCVRTSDDIIFNAKIQEMSETNPKGFGLVDAVDHKHWSKHKFDTTCKLDHVTNNLTESFNSWLGSTRDKPILTLLDGIRIRLMKRMRKRKNEASKWLGDLTPSVVRKLEKRRIESRKYTCRWAKDKEFEIAEGTTWWEVNLNKETCSCYGWQVSGIPCPHAFAAINTCRDDVNKYINWYHKKEAYLSSYSEFMRSIPDERKWPEVDFWVPGPPKRKRQPGRPRKKRIRDTDERRKPPKKRVQSCSNCHQLRHSNRRCSNRTTDRSREEQQRASNQSNNGSSTQFSSMTDFIGTQGSQVGDI